MNLDAFQTLFHSVSGARFKSETLLLSALTHDSCNEFIAPGFERLEFLGDSVVDMVLSAYLVQNGELNEGDMSQVRSALCHRGSLANLLRSWGIEPYLKVGLSMKRPLPDSICADSFESLFGALYLDQGWEVCNQAVLKVFEKSLKAVLKDGVELKNPKSRLQEYAMSRGEALPVYQILSSTGPSHCPLHIIEITMSDGQRLKVQGSNTKMAEKEAAQQMLDRLGLG